jgi:hypothetical protein
MKKVYSLNLVQKRGNDVPLVTPLLLMEEPVAKVMQQQIDQLIIETDRVGHYRQKSIRMETLKFVDECLKISHFDNRDIHIDEGICFNVTPIYIVSEMGEGIPLVAGYAKKILSSEE